ncbi:MAG: valine--tRNA ligase [Chitinophagales bacterium]|nr:valine--tRNA ligase [Chitinophagales bacterium]
MELAKTYDPSGIEGKWYQQWMDNNLFRSIPDDREPYTIVIPPPNVTGVLHMGHMLNNTIQDVLIRKAKLEGYNACWVPGTDHASIATEAKVVAKLREQGIKKSDLSREEFLEHAWDWTREHGGIILEQLKKLGCACDWERTKFTMDDDMSESVIHVFVDLYNKGYIYKGKRIINWDPKAKTALSNEEVIYKDVQSKLYFVKYQIEGSDEMLTIATTRPETILGDTAICVNPDDERYSHLAGKFAIVPIINRKIPIIQDSYVDVEFGTGALKVTPAHDPNDYEIGKRHQLEIVNVMNEDGTYNEFGKPYIGKDRFEVRKLIVKDIESIGQLDKIEELNNSVGYSERTDAVVEPRLSEQWFLDMKKLAGPALENVVNDSISFHPAKFKNTYKHWMENIHEWCLSRQLWWGHQIPAYYTEDGEYAVARNIDDAVEILRKKTKNDTLSANDLKQDEDALDTWASSWLWPIAVFDGILHPDNDEIKYYYPTQVLVTAPEILFFWVARMIMAGYEYRNEKPFKNVYLHGIVRDKQRRKMSKQLGNSPDPLELIKVYGADGVRVGMLFSSPAGNDLLFDEKLCEQGRNFANKIWNMLRLVKSWEVSDSDPTDNSFATEWFDNKLNQLIEELNKSMTSYRLAESITNLYNFIWNDFASWYLEMIKPGPDKIIDSKTYDITVQFFEKLMILLHPFMPFLTEEIWHTLQQRKNGEFISNQQWPLANKYSEATINTGENTKDIICKIREIRNNAQLKNKDLVKCFYRNVDLDLSKSHDVIVKCANLEELRQTDEELNDMPSFVIKGGNFYVDTGVQFDAEAEKDKIIKEMDYTKGFIASVEKKLSNDRFVSNAPQQVVENEKKKLEDSLQRLKVLSESLEKMN